MPRPDQNLTKREEPVLSPGTSLTSPEWTSPVVLATVPLSVSLCMQWRQECLHTVWRWTLCMPASLTLCSKSQFQSRHDEKPFPFSSDPPYPKLTRRYWDPGLLLVVFTWPLCSPSTLFAFSLTFPSWRPPPGLVLVTQDPRYIYLDMTVNWMVRVKCRRKQTRGSFRI